MSFKIVLALNFILLISYVIDLKKKHLFVCNDVSARVCFEVF